MYFFSIAIAIAVVIFAIISYESAIASVRKHYDKRREEDKEEFLNSIDKVYDIYLDIRNGPLHGLENNLNHLEEVIDQVYIEYDGYNRPKRTGKVEPDYGYKNSNSNNNGSEEESQENS